MSEWIKCSDRLPEKDTKVLCYYYDQYMEVMEYLYDDENGKPVFFNPPMPAIEGIQYWMLLPKQPKE